MYTTKVLGMPSIQENTSEDNWKHKSEKNITQEIKTSLGKWLRIFCLVSHW